MRKSHLDKIRSRGYWRINFRPTKYTVRLSRLRECKDIVKKCVVMLRGWDYPHIPSLNDEHTGLEAGDSFYQAWIDWKAHIEFWRMYQSGQFLHYLALREDWMEEDIWLRDIAREPGSSLSIIGTVYQITELYEFLSRLTKKGIYDDGVNIYLSLINTKGRRLWLNDPRRVPLSYEKITSADKIEIPVKHYSKDDIILHYKQIALDNIIYIFERFGWENPPIETIKRDQDNLLSKRI